MVRKRHPILRLAARLFNLSHHLGDDFAEINRHIKQGEHLALDESFIIPLQNFTVPRRGIKLGTALLFLIIHIF